jgi:hypothetical protein
MKICAKKEATTKPKNHHGDAEARRRATPRSKSKAHHGAHREEPEDTEGSQELQGRMKSDENLREKRRNSRLVIRSFTEKGKLKSVKVKNPPRRKREHTEKRRGLKSWLWRRHAVSWLCLKMSPITGLFGQVPELLGKSLFPCQPSELPPIT